MVDLALVYLATVSLSGFAVSILPGAINRKGGKMISPTGRL